MTHPPIPARMAAAGLLLAGLLLLAGCPYNTAPLECAADVTAAQPPAGMLMTEAEPVPPDPDAPGTTQRDVAAYIEQLHGWGERCTLRQEEVQAWVERQSGNE